MLLNVILKTHAWAASRPKHEAAFESQKLEEEIAQIMDTEREQGMCSPTPSAPISSISSSSFGTRVIGMQLLLVCVCMRIYACFLSYRRQCCYILDPCALFYNHHTHLLWRIFYLEQTRQRLGEFVHRMKTALAALMGVP